MRIFSLATFVLATFLLGDMARAQIHEIRHLDTRNVGYTIGDRVPRQIEITVDEDWHLQATSLPAPGQQTYWLELSKVHVDERREGVLRIYRIDLDYQTFYAPIQALERKLPPFTLVFARDNETVEARVPATGFTMSPLREIKLSQGATDNAIALRPDIVPSARPLRPVLISLLLCTAAALILFAMLAWQRAWWPFHARPHRPFAHAARKIRKPERRGAAETAYRSGLVLLHRAFDDAAGHRLLADDADAFITRNPAFASASAEISRFFRASRFAFFANDDVRAEAEMPAGELATFATHLAAAERSRA
jgi:mxaA protein